MQVVGAISMLVFSLGACAVDSEDPTIPMIMVFVGLAGMILAVKVDEARRARCHRKNFRRNR